MKRICMWILILALLAGSAQAALEYNSFFDDAANAGRFDSFAMAGEYVYWLHAPGNSLDWTEKPASLYRMKLGEKEAELVLQGRDDFWMVDVKCIGERLLLSFADENSGQTHPAVMNLDGNFYKVLSGNIGSVAVCSGKIYNSVDGAIYEININKLKPRKVYTYPDDIAAQNPVLTQCEGQNLYFTTDSHDWYRLDLQGDKLHKIDTIRGDGFVKNYKFYVSDYDKGGTYCYDVSGKRTKISDHTYMFQQGSGDYVKAQLLDPAALGSSEGGRIFDMTWMTDNLEDALIGTCNPLHDVLLDGKLVHHDSVLNRVDFSTEPVTERME